MMSTELEGFRHRMVRVGEVNIHAVVGGVRPPVLLLHGFPQTWWAWRKVMPRLAATHTVVAVDLRGAGHSDCPLSGYDKASHHARYGEIGKSLGHRPTFEPADRGGVPASLRVHPACSTDHY